MIIFILQMFLGIALISTAFKGEFHIITVGIAYLGLWVIVKAIGRLGTLINPNEPSGKHPGPPIPPA